MALIWINEVSVSFGGPRLLDGASLRIEAGEKIGLLGRNGSGKSTLMKLLTGELAPDTGEIVRSSGVGIAMLPQDVPDDLPGTVYDVVAAGGGAHLELLREYRLLTRRMAESGDEGLVPELEGIQHRLEASGAWRHHRQVETVISRTGLQESAEFKLLSAGMKRRVFLARALVSDPDLLLLDEPTNHLDIHAILWLETFLRKFAGTLMFVTHDRAFLQRLATRIVEIDRGRLMSFPGDYHTFLERRQADLEAQERQWQEFDKKLAREETWIRQGVKARRTRNEGRVKALIQMRRERERRREQAGEVRLAIQEAERGGRLVVEARKIHFAFAGQKIVEGFSTVILRGDKVGIIGPNGSGKTTLLKILLGDLEPQQGTVRLGSGVRIAYFDQLRAQIDENRSLKENIAGGNDMVVVGGAARHIVGYLQDFLFPPEQILSPVRSLSGGERNRLLLAKLFLVPSNVLVLDEPTNDLDVETLELLEERLMEYGGTILLVSHDRAFLDNVVTSTIVFEGEGRLHEYVGGYDDWLRQRATPAAPVPAAQKPRKERPPKERQKLSYREAQELESLPQKLEALEEEKERLIAILNSRELYERRDAAEINRTGDRLAALEKELDTAYKRWEELEALAATLNPLSTGS